MSHIKGKLSVKRIGSKLFIVDDKDFTVTKVRFSKKAETYAKGIVRRYNAFEEGGIVDKLVVACKIGLDAMAAVKEIAEKVGATKDIIRHKELVKFVENAIAKTKPE